MCKYLSINNLYIFVIVVLFYARFPNTYFISTRQIQSFVTYPSMATSDIPIELRTASEDDLKSMKLFSATRIIKQQQDIERFDYDFLAGLPSKPKQKMSADDWRVLAQVGRIFDLETVLEPDETPLTHPPHKCRLPWM